jgi:hypothetical protein
MLVQVCGQYICFHVDLEVFGFGTMLSSSPAPEDGDSMFLRNVGIDLPIHMVPKPKTSTST